VSFHRPHTGVRGRRHPRYARPLCGTNQSPSARCRRRRIQSTA
jgi:hypothetical protein